MGRETLNDIEEHKIIVNQTLPSMYICYNVVLHNTLFIGNGNRGVRRAMALLKVKASP